MNKKNFRDIFLIGFPLNMQKMQVMTLIESLKRCFVLSILSLKWGFVGLKKGGAFVRAGAFNRTFTVCSCFAASFILHCFVLQDLNQRPNNC